MHAEGKNVGGGRGVKPYGLSPGGPSSPRQGFLFCRSESGWAVARGSSIPVAVGHVESLAWDLWELEAVS